ncbi:hypothetical protein C1708_15315 [Streptomyces sp. DH-12]|nr:hypothetical protein C1708_15315 [Streptomyces sp. DH-12]
MLSKIFLCSGRGEHLGNLTLGAHQQRTSVVRVLADARSSKCDAHGVADARSQELGKRSSTPLRSLFKCLLYTLATGTEPAVGEELERRVLGVGEHCPTFQDSQQCRFTPRVVRGTHLDLHGVSHGPVAVEQLNVDGVVRAFHSDAPEGWVLKQSYCRQDSLCLLIGNTSDCVYTAHDSMFPCSSDTHGSFG